MPQLTPYETGNANVLKENPSMSCRSSRAWAWWSCRRSRSWDTGFLQVHKIRKSWPGRPSNRAGCSDFDSVVVPYDMCMESEAIGNTISLYENSEDILYPTIPEKMWKSMDEVKIPSNIMELGRLPMISQGHRDH